MTEEPVGTGKRTSAREQGKWQTKRKAHSKFIRTISIPILRITLIDLKIFILAFAISLVHKSILSFLCF